MAERRGQRPRWAGGGLAAEIRPFMQILEEGIIEFVASFTGVMPQRIHLDTTLQGDLEVVGDDGAELIRAYGEKFQVDLAEFESARHFGSEGVGILAPLALIWMVLRHPFRQKCTPEERSNLEDVRIRDLVAFARTGRWMSQQLKKRCSY